MRPVKRKRSKQNIMNLTADDLKVLIYGDFYFDGSVKALAGKWQEYRDELLKKYSRPGYRPYAFWILDMGVNDNWLSWKNNVPLAERRKYRIKNGKVLSNREYSSIL